MLAALSCGAIVIAAEPLTIPLLRRAAAVDVPVQRSYHSIPHSARRGTPTAFGLLVATTLTHSTASAPFLLAIAGFSAIGLAEDLRGLSVPCRLGLQSAGVGPSVAEAPARQVPPGVGSWTEAVARC